MAEQLGCSYTTVEKNLSELGKTRRYGVWITHQLSPHQLRYRADVCMGLMISPHNYQWLCHLISGDKKWMLYINYTHRCQWLSAGDAGTATPKSDLHLKKVMLNAWCEVNGMNHREILSSVCAVTRRSVLSATKPGC